MKERRRVSSERSSIEVYCLKPELKQAPTITRVTYSRDRVPAKERFPIQPLYKLERVLYNQPKRKRETGTVLKTGIRTGRGSFPNTIRTYVSMQVSAEKCGVIFNSDCSAKGIRPSTWIPNVFLGIELFHAEVENILSQFCPWYI